MRHRLAPLLLFAAAACSDEPSAPRQESIAPSLTAAAAPLAFRQISLGTTVACGVTTEDLAYCWGTGLLADGHDSYVTETRPRLVLGGLRWRQISAGSGHVCGLDTEGKAWCWGQNGFGQLGDGSNRQTNIPGPVLGGLTFRQIRVGVSHTCAVTPGDVAYCWGAGGQLGNGTSAARSTPVRVLGALRFRQVYAGFFYTCGATVDDRAFCWGDNREGQLGNGRFGARNGSLVPVAVSGNLAFRQVIAGGSHTCGLTRDDLAYCWGLNRAGQVGDGTTSRRSRPAAVAGGRRFDVISVGGQHTCGQLLNGRMFCWGSNSGGQLGDGTTTNRLKPVRVVGGITFTGVSASGRAASCGIADDTRAFCWGEGVFGVLGDGTEQNHLTPTPVAGPD